MENILKAAARSYRIPTATKQLVLHKPPLILAGVTAAGKNTLSSQVCQDDNYQRLVSYTTRPSRGRERHGKDYWFLDETTMFEHIKRQVLIEAQVIHDFIYGTPLEGYLNIVHANRQPVLTIDVNGAALISKLSNGIRPYFLLPPSYDDWMRRLGSRDFLSDGERNRRLHSAAEEISTALNDKGFIFIISDDVEQVAREVKGGMAASSSSQGPARQLAQELYDYIKNQ